MKKKDMSKPVVTIGGREVEVTGPIMGALVAGHLIAEGAAPSGVFDTKYSSDGRLVFLPSRRNWARHGVEARESDLFEHLYSVETWVLVFDSDEKWTVVTLSSSELFELLWDGSELRPMLNKVECRSLRETPQ
jgi:hypothetical protein